MNKLIKYTNNVFEISTEEIEFINVISPVPFILPMADSNMVNDTDEKSQNLLEIENFYPRTKFSYINTYAPENKEEKSYLLVLSTENTIDTTAAIYTIEWEK